MRLSSWASMAALTALFAGSAEAMPTPAPYRVDPGITLAAGGCGYGLHRNIYGNCVLNGPGWGGVVVAPGFYGAADIITADTMAAAIITAGRGMAAVLSRRRLAWRRIVTAAAGMEAALTGMEAALTGMEAALTGEGVVTGDDCPPRRRIVAPRNAS